MKTFFVLIIAKQKNPLTPNELGSNGQKEKTRNY